MTSNRSSPLNTGPLLWLMAAAFVVALGIGALYMISRRGFGHYAGGHAGHGHAGAGGRGTGEDAVTPVEAASDGGRPGTAAVTESTTTGMGASTMPAQGVPQADRRHGCF